MSNIDIEVNGIEETLRDLERLLGKKAIEQSIDFALMEGATVIMQEIESNFESFKQTGASQDEITISAPMDILGVRTIKIYWSGPKNRYSIIHLNEFGTIKNPNPKGKGAIERAIRSGQEAFFNAVKDGIGRSL